MKKHEIKKLKTKHFVAMDLLPEVPIIVDLGACQGQFASEIHEIRPLSEIYCYEPSKSNFKHLLDIDFITPHYGAIRSCNKTGEYAWFVEYCSNRHNGKTPVQKCHIVGAKDVDYDFDYVTYKVPVFSAIEIFVLSRKVDFLKIDIEGAESEIIKDIYRLELDGYVSIGQIAIEVHGKYNREMVMETMALSDKIELVVDDEDELLYVRS